MKRSRNTSFLIRDLLSAGAAGDPTSGCCPGLPCPPGGRTPELSLALSRPSVAKLFSQHQPFIHPAYRCTYCPAWTSGSVLGILHDKCFFSNSSRGFGRLSQNSGSPFGLPVPLPVYVRSEGCNPPPPGGDKARKSRRSRTVFTELQLMGLERRFDKQKYLSTPDRIELADTLGLSQIQVKTWYQNRRMKWKKQVLSAGGTEAPTKPKGRPKKNSIPSAEELAASSVRGLCNAVWGQETERTQPADTAN